MDRIECILIGLACISLITGFVLELVTILMG